MTRELCKAGIPYDLLVAAHGNFDAAHVVDDNVGLASSYDVDIAVPRCGKLDKSEISKKKCINEIVIQ